MDEGEFEAGEKVGGWKMYDEKGKLTGTQIHKS